MERDSAAAARHAAVVLLQRLVRGRAVQVRLFAASTGLLICLKTTGGGADSQNDKQTPNTLGQLLVAAI